MNTHRWEKRDKNDTKMPHRTQPILKLHLARLHHVNSKGGKDSPSIALPHPPTQEILSKESRGITQKLQYQNEIKNTHNSSTLLKKNKTSMNGLERKKTKNNHQKKITHSLQQKQKAHVQMKSSPVTNIVIAESGRRSSDDLLFKQLSYCNDGRRRTSSTHQNTMTTSHETIKDDKSRTLKGSSDSSDYVDIKQSPYRSKSDYKTYDRGSGEDSSSWGNNCFDNEYSTESNNERNKPYSDDEFVNIHNDTYDKIKEVASLSKISSLLGQLCSKTKQFLSKLSLCISFAIALIAVILVSQHILNMRARKKKSTEKRMFTVPTLSPITEIKGIQSKIPSKNYSELPTTSTYQPSNIITNIPSKKYSESPTLLTSQYPSTRPSHVATRQPSKMRTNIPSKAYSESPTLLTSQYPSTRPSHVVTHQPSKMITNIPSKAYSESPTLLVSRYLSTKPSHVATHQPSKMRTNIPSRTYSESPTHLVSQYLSIRPSDFATHQPSNIITNNQSKSYSEPPTFQPSPNASTRLSDVATRQPSKMRTNSPSKTYSESPTLLTSQYPSARPSHVATHQPSKMRTNSPSKAYSESPTFQPSPYLSTIPSLSTHQPSNIITNIPSKAYSESPTLLTSQYPSTRPSHVATHQPSKMITNIPSKAYSESPTLLTSQYPSTRPSHVATHQPSKIITNNPSKVYSESPSFNPSQFFSKYPSTEPTLMPSKMFSGTPSNPYTWHQVGQVLTGRSKDGNEFGKSVSVSSDGKTIAVSSFKNDEILVFDNIGSIWVQRGEALKGPQGSWFGSVLSISANGEIVAGGGFYYDNGRGLVEAFVYNKGTEQWDKLGNTLTGAYEWNMFGSSIDLSSNGMFIIIGENSIENVKQCVQVFEFDGYVWNKRGSTIRGSSASDSFGSPREAVSITSSGDIIAVGSHIGDYVKMFQWKQNDWKLMMSSSTTRGADGSWFGFSVEITSINNNEFVLAVGSPGGSLTSPKLQPGAIHIYDCINDLICTERKQLIKLDYVQSIGHTLTISSDGNIVASSTEVAAVAFTWSNDTWTQLGDLMCKANEGTRNEIPVSLSSDGSIIVVGVPHDGDGFFNGRNYGEGHVFEWKRN